LRSHADRLMTAMPRLVVHDATTHRPPCETRRRRPSRRMGRCGLLHPRPAPGALSQWGPLADPSVQLLLQPRECLDRKVIHSTHSPAGPARVHRFSCGYGQVIVRSLQRRPPSLAGRTWSPLAPVHRSGVVRSGRVPRGRGLWSNSYGFSCGWSRHVWTGLADQPGCRWAGVTSTCTSITLLGCDRPIRITVLSVRVYDTPH
jgi:hypothetical protein